jgi:hypothetical protein
MEWMSCGATRTLNERAGEVLIIRNTLTIASIPVSVRGLAQPELETWDTLDYRC